MTLETIESLIRILAGLLAYAILGIVLYGVWRGTQRPAGRATGHIAALQRSPWFYLVATIIFFGLSHLGWVPLPLAIAPSTRPWLLALGVLAYFPGMLFALWGRLALGKNYFISSGFGSQLFADHQLITSGPYAIVRHPMYSGLVLAALGCLLLYTTWTSLLFTLCAPALFIRSRREEATLAVEFGDAWQAYCRRVPAFIPRPKK